MRDDFRDARALVVGPIAGGSLGIARHCVRAFRKLGVEVCFADFSWLDPPKPWAKAASSVEATSAQVSLASTLLAAKLRKVRPDLCFVLAQAPIDERFFEESKSLDVVTAFWFVENYRLTRSWKWLAPRFDHFFSVQRGSFDEELSAIGCDRRCWLPLACDPDRHRPVRLSEKGRKKYGSDVSFAGYGYYNRRELFSGLVDFDLKIWGPGWGGSALDPFVQNGGREFDERELRRVASASKVHVNLHSASHVAGVDPAGDYVNPRVFELAASGAFQLVDPRSDLPDLFRVETEIPCFRDLDELRRKIEFFLRHPEARAEVAAAARRRALSSHTYRERMQQVLEKTLGESRGTRARSLGELEGFPRLSRRAFRRADDVHRLLAQLGNESTPSDEEMLLRVALSGKGSRS